VGGRLWDDDGAALLAAASILHAGLPRRAAVAAHVRAMEEPSAVKAGGQHESPGKPVSPGGKDTRDPTAGALLAELRRSEVTPRGQLIRLTRRLPVELASQLLSVLDGGRRAGPGRRRQRPRVAGPGGCGRPGREPGLVVQRCSNVPTSWPGAPATVAGRRR
jgi:hypothetical protein